MCMVKINGSGAFSRICIAFCESYLSDNTSVIKYFL